MIDGLITGVQNKSLRTTLILYKPDLKTPLVCITPSSLSLKRVFNDYDELSFSVERYLYDTYQQKNISNPAWEIIEQGLVVKLEIYNIVEGKSDKLEFEEFFSVQQPSYSANETENSKSFSCTAYHQLLFNKLKLRGFDDTRKLTECPAQNNVYWGKVDSQSEIGVYVNPDNEESANNTFNVNDNTKGGILDYILGHQLPDWHITYYDNKLLEISKVDFISDEEVRTFWGGMSEDGENWILPRIIKDENDEIISIENDIAIKPKYYDNPNYLNLKNKLEGKDVTAGNIYLWFKNTTKNGNNDYSTEALEDLVKFEVTEGLIGVVWLCDKLLEIYKGDKITNLVQYVYGLMCDLYVLQNTTFDAGFGQDLDGVKPKDLINEPLYGSKYLTSVKQKLTEIREGFQTLCSYKYIENNKAYLYSPDSATSRDASSATVGSVAKMYSICCSAILYMLIESLQVYNSSPTKIPYRTMKFDSNLTEVFKSIEENFLCIFQFDNTKKTIKIYSRDNEVVNGDKPLLIDDKNIIQSISYQANTDQVITRLYAKGKDGVTLGAYNINGMNYVDNFDYFISKNFINEDLAVKIKDYEDIISDIRKYQNGGRDSFKSSYISNLSNEDKDKYCKIKAIFNGNNIQEEDTSGTGIEKYLTIKEVQDKIVSLSNDLSQLQSLAKAYKEALYSDRYTSETEKEKRKEFLGNNSYLPSSENEGSIIPIAERQAAYSAMAKAEMEMKKFYNESINEEVVNNIISGDIYIKHNIDNLKSLLTKFQKSKQYRNILYPNSENFIFTSDDISELQNYVYEEDITWGDITEADTLYLYAIEWLDYLNKIPISLSISAIDVQKDFIWNDLTDVGSKFYVQYDDFNIDCKTANFKPIFKLTDFTYQLNDGDVSLDLSLSNQYDLTTEASKIINDVWAYSYKKLQELHTYKDSWEDYINKQNALLLQGSIIKSDVNSIINKAGQTVIDGDGLSLASNKNNALTKVASGYYVRDKGISDGIRTTYPDKIIFSGANMTTSVTEDDGNVLTISGMGGGDGVSGFPRYYSAPFCSQKLEALDIRNGDKYIIEFQKTNIDGTTVTEYHIYYCEFDMRKENEGEDEFGGAFFYQMAKLTPSTTTGDVPYEIEPFTDNDSNPLYYYVQGETIDRDILTYIKPESLYNDNDEPISTDLTNKKTGQLEEEIYGGQVMIYKADITPTIQIARTSEKTTDTHVPDIILGIGDNNNNGVSRIRKLKDEVQVLYRSREEQEDLGISIKDDGIYQIRGVITREGESGEYEETFEQKIPMIYMNTGVENESGVFDVPEKPKHGDIWFVMPEEDE